MIGFYLKTPHVSWISSIFQTILIAFEEELEKISEKSEFMENLGKRLFVFKIEIIGVKIF
jgi:hypothetical protein